MTPTEKAGNFSVQVAAEVRAMMGRRGLRQAHLARRLGKNDVWLSVRLNGRQAIDVNDLQLIAAALGCSILDLLPDGVRRGQVEHSEGGPSAEVTSWYPEPHRPAREALAPRLVATVGPHPHPAAARQAAHAVRAQRRHPSPTGV